MAWVFRILGYQSRWRHWEPWIFGLQGFFDVDARASTEAGCHLDASTRKPAFCSDLLDTMENFSRVYVHLHSVRIPVSIMLWQRWRSHWQRRKMAHIYIYIYIRLYIYIYIYIWPRACTFYRSTFHRTVRRIVGAPYVYTTDPLPDPPFTNVLEHHIYIYIYMYIRPTLLRISFLESTTKSCF